MFVRIETLYSTNKMSDSAASARYGILISIEGNVCR